MARISHPLPDDSVVDADAGTTAAAYDVRNAGEHDALTHQQQGRLGVGRAALPAFEPGLDDARNLRGTVLAAAELEATDEISKKKSSQTIDIVVQELK